MKMMTFGTETLLIIWGRWPKDGGQGLVQKGQVFAECVLPGSNEPVNPFPADVRVQIGKDVGVNVQQFLPIGVFFLDADSFRML